ncbi:MAG TPA: TetR/AcrR family transcriptional regulator [Caulobacteraceae bacterium]
MPVPMNVVIATPRRDLKRDTIVAIALQVFLEEGYAAASMSAIAARVGGSKGTLYNYFRSKAELFVAVIQDQCDLQQNQLFDVPEQDIRKFLIELGRRFVRLLLSDEVITLHRIVVAEATRFPEIGEALYEAGPKRGKARLVTYLKQAIADGRLKASCNPERAAEQAMEMALGGMYRRRLWNVGPAPTDDEMEAAIASAIDVFMAAYGA